LALRGIIDPSRPSRVRFSGREESKARSGQSKEKESPVIRIIKYPIFKRGNQGFLRRKENPHLAKVWHKKSEEGFEGTI